MTDALLWNEIGFIYQKMGLLDESIQAYLKAVELKPDSAQLNSNLAHTYFQSKDYGQAITMYRKSLPLLQSAQEQSAVLNKIGDAYRALKDLDNAIAAYRKADELELQPGDRDEARIKQSPGLGIADLSSPGKNNTAPAGALNTTAVPHTAPILVQPEEGKRKTEAPPASQTEGMTPPKKVEPVPASSDPSLEEVLSKIKIYEKITSENPKHHRAWDTLGMLYKSIGRYKDAIQAYLHALDGAPQNENLYYYLGLLYAMEQQDENAILSFEEVLRINPDYILAHSALAGVFRRLGKEAQAREHIASAALQMNSESSYNRACFYAICGDVELSVEFLRLALQNDGTSLDWVKTDPDLEPIRNDPRYREMIHQFESASRHPEDGNFFSSDIDAPNNQLLPLLNDSLTR